MPFNFPTPFAIIVDFMGVECQGRETEKRNGSLDEITSVSAFRERDSRGFGGGGLGCCDFRAEDPVPFNTMSIDSNQRVKRP
jgi:hypothetical protein